MMDHWSVDTHTLEQNTEVFMVWKLENAINFGIRNGRISEQELRKYWDKLDLDPHKKKFLALLLEMPISGQSRHSDDQLCLF